MKTIALTDRDSNRVKNALLPGEEIYWRGTPEDFPLADAANKKRLITRIIVCAALLVVFSILYPVLTVSKGNYNPIISAVIVVALVCIAIVLPLVDCKNVKKGIYYVTDKRVISAIGDKHLFTLDRANLKVSFAEGNHGCEHVLFGEAVELTEDKYRKFALTPKVDAAGTGRTGIVFYNITADKTLKELFND